jgi:hypothetical protein
MQHYVTQSLHPFHGSRNDCSPLKSKGDSAEPAQW